MPYVITSGLKGVRALSDTHQGTEYYNTLFETTDCIVVWEDPPTPEQIAADAAIAADKICCTSCEELITAKFSSGFMYGGYTYQVNGDARSSIGDRAIYAGWSNADPVTFPWVEPYSLGWWDVNNIWHAMTAAEFMLFGKAVSDYVSACFVCCRAHKNALGAICGNALLTDTEKMTAMEAYMATDALTGWPVNP